VSKTYSGEGKWKPTRIAYIAGPISNNPNFKKQFADAQEHLEKQGWIVLNPSLLPPGVKQPQYMKICIAMMEVADMVYFLEGWSESKGACFEWEWCKYHGKYTHFQLADNTGSKFKVELGIKSPSPEWMVKQ